MTTVEAPVEFQSFGKISRLFRPIVVSEKIDGTNAAVGVTDSGAVYAQSRKRVITPGSDNFGFARWVADHADELRDGLGPGLHFGEWWGHGIQRGYDLDEKRFSLFNADRWTDDVRPACCHVVPVLDRLGEMDTTRIRSHVALLEHLGSTAAPGFKPAEGIVVYHRHSNAMFKVTVQDDHKGAEHGA